MTLLDRIPDDLLERYCEECVTHQPGQATAQVAHLGEEEREINRLVAQGRALDGVAVLRWVA